MWHPRLCGPQAWPATPAAAAAPCPRSPYQAIYDRSNQAAIARRDARMLMANEPGRDLSMISAPSLTGVGLLLGLSLFLGFAFEDFLRPQQHQASGRHSHLSDARLRRRRALPVRSHAFHSLYRRAARARRLARDLLSPACRANRDDEGEPNVGLVVPVLNVHAYILGAIALALPPWVAVAFTVTAVLLLTGREKLHALARRVDVGKSSPPANF